MKKITLFIAAILSLFLTVSPAFAFESSLIGTHGRHGKTSTSTTQQNTVTQQTTSATPAFSTNTAAPLPNTATASGTTVLAREVAASVLVNGMAVSGPILYYKNMYYVSLEQLAGLMPSLLTCSYFPASFVFDTTSVRQPDYKSLYMDEHIVFVSKAGADGFYHKMDCSVVEQNGLANYLAIDLGFAENGKLNGTSPCQYCITPTP